MRCRANIIFFLRCLLMPDLACNFTQCDVQIIQTLGHKPLQGMQGLQACS